MISVRDIVKSYYDKKNKKTQGQVTAENQSQGVQKNVSAQVTEVRKVASNQ